MLIDILGDRCLFLGDRHTASNWAVLQANRVRAVLNIGGGPPKFPDAFDYHSVRVADRDDADIVAHLPAATAFIDHHLTQGHCVLVHCRGGLSRSPAFLIAFLCRYRGLTRAQAVEQLLAKRPAAKLRTAFLLGIDQWLASLPEPALAESI